MRQNKFAIITAMLAALLGWVAAPVTQAAVSQLDHLPIGRASGVLGSATIDGQKISIDTPVFEGSRIATGPTDAASVLLNSQVVLKFDSNTIAIVTEATGTHVQLVQGNVEVFLTPRTIGKKAVALSDPDATIEALGTVFVAGYTPTTHAGYYATIESTRPSGIKITSLVDGTVASLVQSQQASMMPGRALLIGQIQGNELSAHLGKIPALDKLMLKQAGVYSRKQNAVSEAIRVQQTVGAAQFAIIAGQKAGLATQNKALSDTTVFSSVTRLASSGTLVAVPGGGSSTTGGGGVITGGTNMVLSDISVLLDTGNVLHFQLLDPGVADGDQISLRVTGNGHTYLSVPNLTLTPTPTAFSPTVNAGRVQISIKALNEGSVPPNSGEISVQSTVTSGPAAQTFELNTADTATLNARTTAPGTTETAIAPAVRIGK